MRLGFDIDEVVCNLADEFEKYILKTYNIEWPIDCFTYFKFSRCNFHENIEMNRKIIDDLNITANDPGFQSKAKPYKDAVVTLRRLKKQGHTLHFITNRPVVNENATIKWFRVNKIPYDSLDVIGKYEKGMVGRALNLDFYLDDLEEHLESMYLHKSRWRKGLGLMTKPWNKDSIDGSKFIRFNNWQEIERHLGIQNR